MKFQVSKKFLPQSALPLAKLTNLSHILRPTTSHIGALLILMAASSTTAAQEMNDLGTFGGTYSYAYGASADGAIIVGMSYLASNSFIRAFRYSNGLMVDLGTLGGNFSAAYGISADGSIIVGTSSLAGNVDYRAFSYANGVMTNIGTLGGSYSTATGISANGAVIVGQAAITGDASRHAFSYTGGVMTDLGTLGGNDSMAAGVSADGAVIVGFSYLANNSNIRAFRYASGLMTDLGTLGGSDSNAYGVSADGTVIVGESTLTGNLTTHAFRHADGVMTDLGTLGGSYSAAYGASANGAVIVGLSYITGNTAYRAFRYAEGVMTDLGTLGGNNSYAAGISADGTIIFGQSENANGGNNAFIYRNNMVDIPGTYVALGTNGQQLNGLLNLRHSLLGVALNDDCTNFGNRNVCVSVGGRASAVDGNTASATAGTLQLGYRVSSHWRVGITADQGLSAAGAGNYAVRQTQPLMAAYAVYAPSGSAQGLQLKASLAYGTDDVSISRTALTNTEAGQGQSSLSTKGAQLEAAYGLPVSGMWQAAPFAGIKSTSVSRAAYTETSGADFPVTYSAVSQSAATAYAGMQGTAAIRPALTVSVRGGIEHDMGNRTDSYAGSIDTLGAFALSAADVQRTRAFASVQAAYRLSATQSISAAAYVSQQPLQSANGATVMLRYRAAL